MDPGQRRGMAKRDRHVVRIGLDARDLQGRRVLEFEQAVHAHDVAVPHFALGHLGA